MLHPSLLDVSTQASIGFIIGAGDPDGQVALKPALPFALEEIEALGICSSTMWALSRPGSGSKAGDKAQTILRAQKLNIDLCDEYGRVCVRVKGFHRAC